MPDIAFFIDQINSGYTFRFYKDGFEPHVIPAGPDCALTIDDEAMIKHAIENGWEYCYA